VNDPNPFPGLTVSPLHGVVPVGGNAELHVKLTPDAVLKFDTRVNVAIKGGKSLELRMGGTVEPPTVDIDLVRTWSVTIHMVSKLSCDSLINLKSRAWCNTIVTCYTSN